MNTSKLLISDRPLVVSPALAVAVGLNEAFLLQQIQYWTTVKGVGRVIDDVHWVYNSIEDWREQFPFWGVNTISRTLARLKARGLIFVEKHDKSKGSHVNFYAINHEALDNIGREKEQKTAAKKDSHPFTQYGGIDSPKSDVGPFTQNGGIHSPNMGQSDSPNMGQSDSPNMGESYTEITTETTTETTTEITGAAPKKSATQKTRLFKPDIKNWASWAWPAAPTEEIFNDWLAMRQKNKFTISLSSMKLIGKGLRDAASLGFSVDDCLAQAELKKWRGMAAEWMTNSQASATASNGNPVVSDAFKQKMDAVMRDVPPRVKGFITLPTKPALSEHPKLKIIN